MPTNRVMRLLSVVAIAPLILTSCDSSNTFDPIEDAPGTYDLSLFANEPVPVTFPCAPGECGFSNGGTFRVNDGTLIIYDDGTWEEINHYTMTPTGGTAENTTFVSGGTYDIVGDRLDLYAPPQNGAAARFLPATFQYAGNDVRIRYSEDGQPYEYRR